jgi:sigma-B regulation protein RsbU (phosphoserine phosphatase)
MTLLSMTVPAELSSIGNLRRSLSGSLKDRALPSGAINDLLLAVSELATNVVLHGRPPATMLQLVVDMQNDILRMCLTDDGGPFADFQDRISVPPPDDTMPLGESGLGLILVRDKMHGLSYAPGPPNMMRVIYDTSTRRL